MALLDASAVHGAAELVILLLVLLVAVVLALGACSRLGLRLSLQLGDAQGQARPVHPASEAGSDGRCDAAPAATAPDASEPATPSGTSSRVKPAAKPAAAARAAPALPSCSVIDMGFTMACNMGLLNPIPRVSPPTLLAHQSTEDCDDDSNELSSLVSASLREHVAGRVVAQRVARFGGGSPCKSSGTPASANRMRASPLLQHSTLMRPSPARSRGGSCGGGKSGGGGGGGGGGSSGAAPDGGAPSAARTHARVALHAITQAPVRKLSLEVARHLEREPVWLMNDEPISSASWARPAIV